MEKDLKRFFEILDLKEESDNGVEFSPVTIHSCRVMLTQEMNDILKRLREQVSGL